MTRTKKMALYTFGCLALLVTGTVFAFWTGTLQHTNKLQADRMKAEVIEEFASGSSPTGTVTKKVSFKNDSSSSAFLRVCYAETWQKTEQNETVLLNNQINQTDIATKNWTNGFAETDSSLWWYGSDGWYYYKRVLAPGSTTEEILQSVTFPDYSGTYAEYDGAAYQLYFRMELLQASDSQFTLNSDQVNANASKAVFNKTATVGTDGTVSWQ